MSLMSVVVHEGFVGLVFRNGRYLRTVRAGRHFIPFAKLQLVDARETMCNVPNQELLTRDQVAIKVSAVARYRVVDAARAVSSVQSYLQALYLHVQLAARAVVGAVEIEDGLGRRAELDGQLRNRVIAPARELGLEVIDACFKDFMIAGDLKKSFGDVVRHRKEGQAALEKARGEAAALRVLANAARLIEAHPDLLNLRLIQALGPQSSVVFGATGIVPPRGQPLPLQIRHARRRDTP